MRKEKRRKKVGKGMTREDGQGMRKEEEDEKEKEKEKKGGTGRNRDDKGGKTGKEEAGRDGENKMDIERKRNRRLTVGKLEMKSWMLAILATLSMSAMSISPSTLY